MNDRLISRLRDGAARIHSIGPALAADLLEAAAVELEGRQTRCEWDGKPGNPCLCGREPGGTCAYEPPPAECPMQAILPGAKFTAPPSTMDRIRAAMSDLGDKVIGLACHHRGRSMRVLAHDYGKWIGWSTVDDEDPDEPISGEPKPTPMEALDSCANACDAIENPEGEDE